MVSTSVSGGSTSFPTGSALSAHHEIQLLREQLEQQSQQTQAALAQLQLAREQLAAEQSARMEAQARTHQLLIHNRELLDHIAALVVHLQEGEKSSGHSQLLPHVAMPQVCFFFRWMFFFIFTLLACYILFLQHQRVRLVYNIYDIRRCRVAQQYLFCA